MSTLNRELCQEQRKFKKTFLDEVTEYRNELYKFCRKLTSDPWDAEDLVQETLATAYDKLADKHTGIQNTKAYLFKMASHKWIDWCRKLKRDEQYLIDYILEEEKLSISSIETKDSLTHLAIKLAPKERVCFVLSEVFSLDNKEIAEIVGISEGSVKSALHRTREKINSKDFSSIEMKRQNKEIELLIDKAVNAFNKRDIESFSALFIQNAISNGPGCFYEIGLDEIRNGSLFYTNHYIDGSPQPAEYTARKIQIGSEVLFALFQNHTLDDVWKFTVDQEEILFEKFDCYYCCPNVLNEVAELLKLEVNNHGFYFGQKI